MVVDVRQAFKDERLFLPFCGSFPKIHACSDYVHQGNDSKRVLPSSIWGLQVT